MNLRDRYVGALLGLAAGDALGATLEFTPRERVRPVSDMVGGGRYRLAPGQWTDDTSMALCLAESLVERRGFDPVDQLQRYLRWHDEGYWSSTGKCFDIGGTTRRSLARFRATGEPFCGPTAPETAGNGSLMRLAPVPLFFAADPEAAIRHAADSSRTTHAARAAIDACRYFAALLVGALDGRAKDDLLQPQFSPVPGLWEREPLCDEVAAVASGDYARKEARDIPSHGYVVETLEAALWAFAKTNDFETGALAGVNLGWDADTTGAVFGQIAGAYYGVEGIPKRWRELVARGAEIEELASRVFEMARASVRPAASAGGAN